MAEESSLEVFKKKRTLIQRYIDTLEFHHTAGYLKGTEVLKNEAGMIDYKKLETTKGQLAFIQTWADSTLEAAIEQLQHLKGMKLDEEEKELLSYAVFDISKPELTMLVKEYGPRFKIDVFRSYLGRFRSSLEARFIPQAYTHISEEEHKAAIVKELGLEDKVNVTKMDAVALRKLLEIYHAHEYKTIPEEAYTNEIFYIKPEEREKLVKLGQRK